MKNPLYKTFKKDFKQNFARYFSIFIIIVVMISAVSGFLTVAYGYQDELKKNQEECLVEDGQIVLTEKLDSKTINQIQDKKLKIYENFYSEQKINNDTTIRLFKNRTQINKATLYSGRLAKNNHEITLDRLFAEKNNYQIGDYIQIQNYTLKVVGLMSVPDYSSLIEKNTDLMMDPIHFGVAIVDNQSFENYAKNKVAYLYSYYSGDKLTDKENYDMLNQMKDICIENGYQLTQMMTAQMNQCISFLPNDMGGDIPMIQMLLYILMVILAFIFVVISQTIIEEESAVIGTLMANGYTRKEIVYHYMILPIFVTFVGCVVGNILGYTVMPPFFKQIYLNSYCLPPLQVGFMKQAFMTTTLIPFIFMVVVLYLMLSRKLRLTPLQFMRNDLKKHRMRRYIHLKSKTFISRYQQRVLLQNMGTYVMLFFGIFFASFLFMFGFVLTPTINHYLDEINQSVHADYQYILKTPVDNQNGEKATITSLETYYELGDLDLDVSVYGIQDNSQYYSYNFPNQKNHVIVSYDLAHKLNKSVGDQIKLTNPYTEKDYTLTIDQVNHDKGVLAVYISQEKCNQMFDKESDYYNAYLSNKELDIDDMYIQSLVTKEDMTKIGEQMTDVFSQTIPIMTTISLIIYFVVIYILTKLVLDRNAHHMSFLKVMGYENNDIKKVYLHATSIVVVISLLVSTLLCGLGLKVLFQFAFMDFAGYLEAYVPYYLYGITVLVGLMTYRLIYSILTYQIQKIHLGDSLKEVD